MGQNTFVMVGQRIGPVSPDNEGEGAVSTRRQMDF